jgi:hypothetical protein
VLYKHANLRGGRRRKRGSYRILLGKCEKMTPFGTFRRRLEDEIKTDLKEVGRGHGLD